jgi:hypothetical protein
VCRLVVCGDLGGLAEAYGVEHGEAERDVMGGRLAAVLEERVCWVGGCEGLLVGVSEVDVVEREGYCLEVVWW